MSFATVNNQDAAPPSNEEASKPTYRSYKYRHLFSSFKKPHTDYQRRKKFLKMRHNFKNRMRDSNKFFDEEQHAMRLARRLQEQNE